jgi:hypothetical protein
VRDRIRAWAFKIDALRALACNQVILIVGPSGSGKSFLASRLRIPIFDPSPFGQKDVSRAQHGADGVPNLRELPVGPFVLEEPFYFDPAALQRCIADIRGRGFVLTLQSIDDVDSLGLGSELENHHCSDNRPMLIVQLER